MTKNWGLHIYWELESGTGSMELMCGGCVVRVVGISVAALNYTRVIALIG